MKRYLLIISFLTCILSAKAQISNLPMMVENMPQNMSINPALAPEKSYLSFPLIGGLNIGARTSIGYSDAIKWQNGKKYLDYTKLMSVLSSKSDVTSVNVEFDILRGGFYVSNNDFIDLSVRNRVFMGTDLPEGILPFLMDNPADLTSGMYNLSMSPYIMGWGEFGIGYSRRINDNFRVGIRGKYLFGIAGVFSDGLNFNIEKSYDKYYVSGQYNVKGGNVNFSNMTANEFITGMVNNPGFGIDFGGEFISDNQKIKAIISVSDFGIIYWNDANSSSISGNSKGQRFEFDGFGDLSSSEMNFGRMADSVVNKLFKTIGSDTLSGGFSTYLPTKYHAMVEYAIDDNFQHNVSLSFMGIQPYKRGFDYVVSAGYTYRSISGRWQLMANYSYRPYVPLGVGVGGAYTGRKFQLFLGVDNIMPIFGLKNVKEVGGRFSMNFFF